MSAKLDVDLEGFEHPEWCDRDLCALMDCGDLVHRELGRVLELAEGRTAAFVRFRGDEVAEDGTQVVWPSECWLTVDDHEPVLVQCPEDAAAIATALGDLI